MDKMWGHFVGQPRYLPSIEVMDDAARRLGAPNHQVFLAVASPAMKCAFELICRLIGKHEPPPTSIEANYREAA